MERLGEAILLPAGRGPREGRAARARVRERAAKVIGDPGVLDDIELMTSEALANAELHGSGQIRIAVATDGRRLRVEVSDDGPAGGRERSRCGVDHGRGLAVIDALASDWALERIPGRTRLWFIAG